MIHRGEKGFTLIELLVVVAILGVIAAVVALNVGSFFGQGTLQSANTELHQVQTAVISCMADCESGVLATPADGATVWWAGGNGSDCPVAPCSHNGSEYGSFYVYGPFRAAYQIDHTGRINQASINQTAYPQIGNPWTGIEWDATNKNWIAT